MLGKYHRNQINNPGYQVTLYYANLIICKEVSDLGIEVALNPKTNAEKEQNFSQRSRKNGCQDYIKVYMNPVKRLKDFWMVYTSQNSVTSGE
jgi:hypothetical protein